MDRLFSIVTWIQILGGIVFFTALFVAPLALSIKILAAIALMFVSCSVFLLMALLASTQSLKESLRDKHPDGSQDPNALTAALFHRLITSARPQSGGRMGYIILGVFALWIVFGWMFKIFFQV